MGVSLRAAGSDWRVRVRDFLSQSPSFPLLLAATAAFVWFAGDEGGFNPTTFLPGGLLVLALLAVALVALPAPRPPRSILLAICLLAAFAAWCYLSITWADDKAAAWDGANRTTLYALVFALFALWPLRGVSAPLLLGVFGVSVAGVGLVELLRAEGAAAPIDYFNEGRLAEPAGYINANVALWSSAFWPCLILSGRRELPALLRGILLGSAGLLACLAVLGQSRGWIFVVPVMVVIAVVLAPGRGRTIASLAAVAAAILIVRRPLLDVYDGWEALRPAGARPLDVSEAARAILIATGALAVIGFVAALVDRRVSLADASARRINAGLVVLFALGCIGSVVGYAAIKGDPVQELSEKWSEFKEGGTQPDFEGSRFSLAVSTYRYDYWRVAWREFEEHPFAGVGVDNFERDYLVHGRSKQTPKYPHSVALRPLSQTGIVGGLLFFGALAAALVAAFPVLRRPGLVGATGGAALLLFAYFMVHGTLDWFWEFAGLGGPAFAMLGIAASLGSVRPERGARLPGGRLAAAGMTCLGLAIAGGMAVPWLAARDLQRGRELANTDPTAALDRLDRAARLNPLSTTAYETAALIELRTMREQQARAHLRDAIRRDPGAAFPHLELGAIASMEGRRRDALRLLRRAHALAPRDRPTSAALRRVEGGKRISPEYVNRLIVRDLADRVDPQ